MPSIKLKSFRSLALTDNNEVLSVIDNLSDIFSALNQDPVKIPLMTARRLSKGSKLALDVGNTFLQDNIDALVFSSRHGELSRSFNILKAMHDGTDISPTDFSMSVHNACASQYLITNKIKLPYSSIAASENTFLQGLYETLNFLCFGFKRVLYIDFDSKLPIFYKERLKDMPSFDFASAFLFEKNKDENYDYPKCYKVNKEPETHANLCDINIDINKLKYHLGNLNKDYKTLPQSLLFIKDLKGL